MAVLAFDEDKGREMQAQIAEAAPLLAMKLEENCAKFGKEQNALYLLERELEDKAFWREKFLLPQQFKRLVHRARTTERKVAEAKGGETRGDEEQTAAGDHGDASAGGTVAGTGSTNVANSPIVVPSLKQWGLEIWRRWGPRYFHEE